MKIDNSLRAMIGGPAAFFLGSRKVRDIYGNWVWETDDKGSEPSEQTGTKTAKDSSQHAELEWRDWIALALASLQTILLPFIVIIILLFAITIFVTHW